MGLYSSQTPGQARAGTGITFFLLNQGIRAFIGNFEISPSILYAKENTSASG